VDSSLLTTGTQIPRTWVTPSDTFRCHQEGFSSCILACRSRHLCSAGLVFCVPAKSQLRALLCESITGAQAACVAAFILFGAS